MKLCLQKGQMLLHTTEDVRLFCVVAVDLYSITLAHLILKAD